MQDHEMYQRIAAGVAPWTVGEIAFESAAHRLDVQVECNHSDPQRCPHCECMLFVCNRGEEQTWRQPDTGPWQIFLKGRVPLIECPEHGIVRVSPPWADWYVRGPDKSLQGPWSLQQIKMLLDAGRISPSTLLKRGSSNKWVIMGTVMALFVRQDETSEPPMSEDEIAAVDWAIAGGPDVFTPAEPAASDHIVSGGKTVMGRSSDHSGPSSHSDGNQAGDSHTTPEPPTRPTPTKPTRRPAPSPGDGADPRRDRPTGEPLERENASVGPPEINLDLRLLEDSERDDFRDRSRSTKPSKPSAPREPEKKESERKEPEAKQPAKPKEPNPAEWNKALEQLVKMEHSAKSVRKKPVEDSADEPPVKAAPQRDALVRRRGFQHGYRLLMYVYLINACLVAFLVPAVCMIFFSRLLLLSASVFAPFEGGNNLQGNQLVACGLSALSLLVLIVFPVWHLISNDGILWHYIPSGLVGMIVGFGIPPNNLDEVCAALKWCEVAMGIATVGLTLYTLSVVPARSRMSPPLIASALVTALAAAALCYVRTGSMLTVEADVVPPQLRGALPDASLYVFGLFGTLVFLPAAILFELYWHTEYSTRQFIIRTGILMGVYLLVGCATLAVFVKGAGADFFDVPLALLPLACVNALAAAIPSALLLVDPQYSVTQD